MTLSDLASLICSEINQQESEDVAACKTFLQRGFAIIWQAALWKDSLFSYTFTVPSTAYSVTDSWLPTKKVLLVVPDISHVIAVRTGTFHLNVESPEVLYRADWDEYTSTGRAQKFSLMSPCVWEWDTAQTLYRRVLDVGDLAAAITVDVFTPGTNTRSRITGTSLGSIDRIDAITKPGNTAGQVGIGGPFYVTNTGVIANDAGVQTNSVPAQGSAFAYELLSGVAVPVDANIGDFVYTSPQYINQGQVLADTIGPGNTPTGPFGTLSFNSDTLIRSFQASTPLITLQATDTVAVKRQRIQFVGAITAGTILRVLGKVTMPTFTADSDEPALTGCEDALIAFAHARMLRKERQYQKAAGMMQEAAGLLTQLKAEQTVQQAHSKRFIPEDGYGDDFGFSSAVMTDVKDW